MIATCFSSSPPCLFILLQHCERKWTLLCENFRISTWQESSEPKRCKVELKETRIKISVETFLQISASQLGFLPEVKSDNWLITVFQNPPSSHLLEFTRDTTSAKSSRAHIQDYRTKSLPSFSISSHGFELIKFSICHRLSFLPHRMNVAF